MKKTLVIGLAVALVFVLVAGAMAFQPDIIEEAIYAMAQAATLLLSRHRNSLHSKRR